ncbi:MAG: hypothetical protein ABSH53_18010 [Holophaga sp.]
MRQILIALVDLQVPMESMKAWPGPRGAGVIVSELCNLKIYQTKQYQELKLYDEICIVESIIEAQFKPLGNPG